MERLKSGILLVMIGLTAGPVLGQQAAPSAPPAGFVAVVGDVERCKNYPIPGDSPLTVRQAVQNAGLVSDMVNVKVIRATQDRAQFTQVVSASSADSGEPVMNGDVLLVQSMSPMKTEVRKNAALRTDSGVIVVGLEGEGIKIGDVLLYAQAAPPAEGQIKVISRFQGQPPIARPELFSPTTHGDVISVCTDNRRMLKGFGNMAPAVSEWKTQTASLPLSSTTANSATTGFDSTLSNVPLSAQPFELPPSPSDTMLMSIPRDSTIGAEGFAADVDNESSSLTNTLPISQSEDVADMGDEATVNGKVRFASESVDVAPVAPAEIKTGEVAATKSSNFNPWNLVFVGGLLLAGTLILAGTLRPDPDDNGQFIESATRESIAHSNRFKASTIAPQTPTVSTSWQNTPKSERPTESPEVIEKSTMASVAAELKNEVEVQPAAFVGATVSTNNLVASHEWFGGDWNGRKVQGHDSPARSASETDANVNTSDVESSRSDSVTTNETSFNSTATAISNECSVAIPNLPLVEEQSTEKPVAHASAKSVTNDLSAAQVIVSDSAVQEIVSAISDIVASADAITEEIADQTQMSDLEDLLQNRLPIDLCEAQLPLRIALFGTPAGPRRLRIDAAHKTVPPPHINLSADKRRKHQATVTSASAQIQTAADTTGGLDRALHFLQERTES